GSAAHGRARPGPRRALHDATHHAGGVRPGQTTGPRAAAGPTRVPRARRESLMTTRVAPSPYPVRSEDVRPTSGRVLVVMRWPVGGIRTHILYNAPLAGERGYHFTFLGPDDASFDTFAATFSALPGVEFVRVPARRRSCPMWRAVRRELRTGRYDLLHAHGIIAAVHSVAGGFGIRVPRVATLHDVFRPCHVAGWRGRVKRWLLGRVLR